MKNITRKLAAGLFVLSLAAATMRAGDIGIPPRRPVQIQPFVTVDASRSNAQQSSENSYLGQLWPSLAQALVALF